MASSGLKLLSALLLVGCGSAATGPDPRLACVSEVRQSVEVASPGSPISVADAVRVRAVTPEGCAPLDAPLVAFNWFSFADRDLFIETFDPVVEILARRGHEPVMFASTIEVLEAPTGEPRFGGRYVHEAFVFPLYTSAGDFLDMLVSDEFQQHVTRQQAAARREDYFWGLQQCVVGCPFGRTTPVEEGTFLLHIFDMPSRDFHAVFDRATLTSAGVDVFYAGETVAALEIEIDGQRIQPNVRPWGNGTAVYRVSSAADARRLVDSPAFRAIREKTRLDVLAIVAPAGPPH